MQKVAVLFHREKSEEILSFLHEIGVLEISEAKKGVEIDHTEVGYRHAELEFAIQTLKEFASKQTKVVAAKKATTEEIVHAASHTDVRGIVDELRKLEEADTEAHRRLQELATLQKELAPWKKLKHDLSSKNATETSVRLFGTIKDVNLHVLRDALLTTLPRLSLEEISNQARVSYVVATVWKEDETKFEEAATEHGWTAFSLPAVEGTVTKVLEEAVMETKKLSEGITKNTAKRKQLSLELPNLTKTLIFHRWLSERQSVREATAETDATGMLLGWIPRNQVDLLEDKLTKVSPATALLKVKADEGEEVPVLLKNSKLLTPFESVTGLYGLPLSDEMDPTKSLSPFFILYFALCLTDAGYGAILALIFGTVIFKKKLKIEDAKLIWLLFFGGIVTFFVSIPFGGWLGFTPEQVPAIFTKETAQGLLFRGQIWDLTAESGITFLQNLALVLGLTHLFFGMFLAGQHKWLHGRKIEALWQDFTSHLLGGAVLLRVVAPEHLSQIATYVLYGSIVIFIWGKGYGSKWYIRPIMGLIGLLNFGISMISNSLSYLRILALGLVTGALATAVNQVAVEMGNLFPIWLAIPTIILIFVLGHTVSIALNTLGSFIHSGRLQFIEFFSQFFEGGGRGFTPFKRTT